MVSKEKSENAEKEGETMKKAIVIAIAIIMTVNHLVIAETITGTVRRELDGKPIAGLWVEATDYFTGQYCGGACTDFSGFYFIDGLSAGTYRVMASNWSTDFVQEYYNNAYVYYDAKRIDVPANGVVQDIDFSLRVGLKASGKVTDKATGAALDNIRVTYWNNDFKTYTYVYTDIDGTYELTHLLSGDVHITAEPESYYGMIGAEFELIRDINNLDFVLPVGARLSGKVIDSQTSRPLARIEVTYWNDDNAVFQGSFTHCDGTFTFKNLPPRMAAIKTKPDIDTGYALSNPPLGGNTICITEGEDGPNQIIVLHKGALAEGYIKDPYGDPMRDFSYNYSGPLCEGDSATDDSGRYQIRLPVGTYYITEDEDDYGALPQEVTITDVNLPVNVLDIVAYSKDTGRRIEGSVNNPGGQPKTGNFLVAAFKAGTVIDPNTFYKIETISDITLPRREPERPTTPFTITKLPPGVNYDILLLVVSDPPDGIESAMVRDSVLDVPVGTNGINLNYNSEGSMVTGKVINATDEPVFGITVLLTNLATGDFSGLADVDCWGSYIIYNVPAGTYTITAIHSKCSNASETVQVVDGKPANVSDIVMTCTGE
jgi:hypothetical protein